MQHATTTIVLIGVGALLVLAATVVFVVARWEGLGDPFGRAFVLGLLGMAGVVAIDLGLRSRPDARHQRAVHTGGILLLLLAANVLGSTGGLLCGLLLAAAVIVLAVSAWALTRPAAAA